MCESRVTLTHPGAQVERLKQAIAAEQEKRHADELRERQQQLEKEASEFESLFAQSEKAKKVRGALSDTHRQADTQHRPNRD